MLMLNFVNETIIESTSFFSEMVLFRANKKRQMKTFAF